MQDIFFKIKDELLKYHSKIILIHSDILFGFKLPFTDTNQFFNSHYSQLRLLCENSDIWMPTFNYDFCEGKTFNLNITPSQVGSLTEYFRKNHAEWRTPIPVFSFAGIGKQPGLNISKMIDPFDRNSAFQVLYEQDALLMHYGSFFNTSTILHFAERISNQLSYRYDKLFYGKIIDTSNIEIQVVLSYHVRPLGRKLDYDWEKIENDLIASRILNTFQEGRTRVLMCKVKELVNYWCDKLTDNPFYLLNKESKMWVEPMISKLGRPFTITDFEIPKEL